MLDRMKIEFTFSRGEIHPDEGFVAFYGAAEGSDSDIVIRLPIDDPRCRRYLEEPFPFDVFLAVYDFAHTHGRCWKAKLRDLWTFGGDADSPELRRARNIIGPSGLDKIKP